MDTTFMNSEKSDISNLHKLLLNLTDKTDLQIGEKCVVF